MLFQRSGPSFFLGLGGYLCNEWRVMKLTHQFLLLALMVALLAVTAGFGWNCLEKRREVEQQEIRLAHSTAELAKTKAELARRDNLLRLMKDDPGFVSRMARDQLGYVRPDEMVVSPREPAPAPRTNPAIR